MRRNIKSLAALLTVCLALGVAGCAAKGASDATKQAAEATKTAETEDLTIAIAGMVIPESGLDYYLGLSKYVGKKVGRPVRLIHKADYAEVNEMLGEGKIDVAFVCSGPYVSGHDRFGLKLVAAPVVNGKPQYYSYIITPKSSDATSLASLRGKIFAYADPESNTGCIVPKFMITDMGYDPATFFRRAYFTYGHDNSIKAVADGQADGAAVDSLIWDYQNATDSTYTSKTRVIQRSQAFAIPPVVARPGLDPALMASIREAFLKANEDPEGKELLEHMKIERFVVIEDSAYDSIRRMAARIAQ